MDLELTPNVSESNDTVSGTPIVRVRRGLREVDFFNKARGWELEVQSGKIFPLVRSI